VAAAKTKRRAPARKRAASSRRTPVRQHLAPWARDAAGIGLVVFALIGALAVWFDAAGVVGHGINVVLHAVVGSAAVTFPVVALYWGVLLLRGSPDEQRVRMSATPPASSARSRPGRCRSRCRSSARPSWAPVSPCWVS
jgi:hypothetical protein